MIEMSPLRRREANHGPNDLVGEAALELADSHKTVRWKLSAKSPSTPLHAAVLASALTAAVERCLEEHFARLKDEVRQEQLDDLMQEVMVLFFTQRPVPHAQRMALGTRMSQLEPRVTLRWLQREEGYVLRAIDSRQEAGPGHAG